MSPPSHRANTMSVIGVVCGVIFIGLGAAALATNEWYKVEVGAVSSKFGLFKTCGGSCETIDFDVLAAGAASVTNNACTREKKDVEARWRATQAMGVLSVLFVALGTAALLIAKLQKHVAAWRYLAIVFLVLATFVMGVCCVVFVHTVDSWLYCDEEICKWYEARNTSCSSKFGYSFILAVIAAFFGLVGAIFNALVVRFMPPAKMYAARIKKATGEAPPPTAMENRQREALPVRDTARQQPQTQTQQSQPATQAAGQMQPSSHQQPVGNIPEGDWVLDEESGLYWSDKEFLYLESETGHYYDPNSEMWYDPSQDKWYTRDE